ncbi:hypothetical protein [Eisenbergiella porci]|uniref:hypothetical protein n=1 Tax=Eisenbergiella porci TaxID=2652274 RepID=UPI002A8176FC|nr:hypothetical protein [Eisenbergiella porci]
MVVIEMLFSGIKDMSKLYQEERVPGSEDPFGGEATITSWNYFGKDYCEQIMLTVNGALWKLRNTPIRALLEELQMKYLYC